MIPHNSEFIFVDELEYAPPPTVYEHDISFYGRVDPIYRKPLLNTVRNLADTMGLRYDQGRGTKTHNKSCCYLLTLHLVL